MYQIVKSRGRWSVFYSGSIIGHADTEAEAEARQEEHEIERTLDLEAETFGRTVALNNDAAIADFFYATLWPSERRAQRSAHIATREMVKRGWEGEP